MSRQDKTTITNKDASLTHERNELDFPVLPVQQMRELHEFRPDIVDFIVEETKNESAHRRLMEQYATIRSFWGFVIGQVFGLLIGLGGIAGGLWATLEGHDGVGGTIASIAIGTLAVAFIRRQKN